MLDVPTYIVLVSLEYEKIVAIVPSTHTEVRNTTIAATKSPAVHVPAVRASN